MFLVLGVFGLAYASTIGNLFAEWQREEYSHGFLVPFLVGLMVLNKLAESKDPMESANRLAILVVAVSSLLLLVSIYSTFRQLGFFSLVLFLVGLSLASVGYKNTKSIFPIFIFLLLVMPLPFVIHNNLSLNLKMLSSSIGVEILQVLGYSVFQDGNIIDLGRYKLQVVDACNGMRYLFPTLSLSYLIAYLYNGAFYKRAVIFLSAIPITIVMNSLRIATIGILVDIWGPQAAEGIGHTAQGYIVFIMNIICLLLIAGILIKLSRRDSINWAFLTLPDRTPKSIDLNFNKSYFVIVSIGLISFVFTIFNPFSLLHDRQKHSTPNLYTFPLETSSWVGARDTIKTDILKELDLSDYILATYKKPQGQSDVSVNMYIAYYDAQEVGSSIHSPKTCLPGGGWEINFAKTVTLDDVIYRGKPLKVMRVEIAKGQARQIVYYWFDERSRVITNQIAAKYYLMLDSLLTGRSDGALVRVITIVNDGEDIDNADRRLVGFLKEVLPNLEAKL